MRGSPAAVAAFVLAAGCKSSASDHPKPAPVSSPAMVASSAAPLLPVPVASATAQESADAAAPAPGEGRRLLVLGDSHLFGGITAALKRGLSHDGKNLVWIYGSCGSSPPTWNNGVYSLCGASADVPGKPPMLTRFPAKTPHVEELLAEAKPDATLLIMGSNFISSARSLSDSTHELVRRITAAGSRCVWLGPPLLYVGGTFADQERVDRFYVQLATVLGDTCALLDSRHIGVRLRGTDDAVHVEPLSAAKWGEWAAARFLGDPDPFAPAPP